MKQVLIRQGRAVIEEVPAPRVEPGTVLVQVDHSCISVGTEMSALKSGQKPLWKRALENPKAVRTTLQMVANQGFTRTKSQVQGKLSAGQPTGYSAAGIVTETGSGVEDLKPGDRVACAGAQFAHHAEYIVVPRNLVVPIPGSLDFAAASTVTLGAIALQGVRRANPTLGETFVVIGLGILGQLAAQLLKVNGCRVIGSDLDSTRIKQAQGLGMAAAVPPEDPNPVGQVLRLTSGIGADGVIITASSDSDEIVSTAFQMCRKKGRVVLVGDVGLHLRREDFYKNEIDFLISSSYGPGRYDKKYEEDGQDYPPGYVRWTENRNMQEFLRLLEEEKVQVHPLILHVYPLAEAPNAYEVLNGDFKRPLFALFSYPSGETATPPARMVPNPAALPGVEGQIRIALIGAGGFARAMHLPNLQKLSSLFHLRAIMSRAGHSAAAAAKQFGASYSTTDPDKLLADDKIDAVLIATRHDSHAELVLKALQAGKHVLVEKPLALNEEELQSIAAFYDSFPKDRTPPLLMTGFNRRFSPFAQRINQLLSGRTQPLIMDYQMNAGFLPNDHWVHQEAGGGRNIGEACHIYDLMTFWTQAKIKTVEARTIRQSRLYRTDDNFITTLTFEDGSLATLVYTSMGHKDYPKEHLEMFFDGKVIALSDYRRLRVAGLAEKGLETKFPEKGHREELEAFARAVQQGGEWPIPLWQQLQAMQIAFQVQKHLLTS
ncbi:MAG: oxidoreductase [Nitrospinae bacterium CG11_big_fil_rev_8_21_14_0_20_56_8]|nr:MAG: oxidoreductase [Nitrospinae bacterium CG11_big_fil_rev_8_21_14_0_20_56_8]